MLEMIVFVTPPLNDLGDIKGDKKAGRQEDYPNSAWKRKYYTAFYANNARHSFSSWIPYADVRFTHFSLAEPVEANRRPRPHKGIGRQKGQCLCTHYYSSRWLLAAACPNETDESIK